MFAPYDEEGTVCCIHGITFAFLPSSNKCKTFLLHNLKFIAVCLAGIYALKSKGKTAVGLGHNRLDVTAVTRCCSYAKSEMQVQLLAMDKVATTRYSGNTSPFRDGECVHASTNV